ncbi:MAG TPA: DCC1-like thiol-disulfide oxidoreductase family protein [Stackebrandtia sp.]|uniref:thiol-disulfide oxidoreductase DCC family protein n=1 Tax=Stackebrandtia sp. TaxID=2023065 RepID=UPI002D5B59E6|nr:DCC1-like thiol-disulfide oxidoreductase family protein [Stackebrandtia sp.]HZE39510.1 DCC1-like thiol-disulfide oxidoreductase family protein [Stackebrandtia sp.]
MTNAAFFLYDGDCAFCTRCAEFIVRRVRPGAAVEPWQRFDIAAAGLSAADCQRAVQWVDPPAPVRSGPAAIAAVLRDSRGRLGFWRAVGRVADLPPVRAAAGPVYRLVARNRHRMPGGTASCALR